MEEKIINLYLSGYGSTTIVKMLNIPKRKILKILNEHNLINKKENPIYKQFEFDGSKWYTFYECECCKNNIKITANKKYHLSRNLKNKKICKPCSLDLQKGVNNPFYNKTHSLSSKEKISESRKNKGTGVNNSMAKLENRLKVSEALKNKWGSGDMEDTRKMLSDLMSQRIKNGELKSYNRSKAEDEIIDYLKNRNIDCQPSFNLDGKIFDIYIPKYNLLIEYNGDYWHCNPEKYDENYYHKKKDKLAKEIWEYDKNKLYLAEKNDYTYEVIWELDYKKDPTIINKIINKYEKNC
jgi:hypothetical protein